MKILVKNFILCFALLFLTACIPVDDFGDYWGKGTVDKRMTGRWLKVSSKERVRVKITYRKGTMVIDSLDPQERRKKGYAPLFARQLKAGRYTYLMASTRQDDGRESSDLVRYHLKDHMLVEYSLSDREMIAFLKRKYPKAKNIGMPACKGECLTGSVRIRVLDDEVFKILSDIPDTDKFWTRSDKWKKIN